MAEIDGIELGIAIRKIHEWSMTEGDIGREYWYGVRKLLELAADMQEEIDALSKELEMCRAQRNRKS